MEIQMVRGIASPTYDITNQVIALIDQNDYPSVVAVLSGLSTVELATIRTKMIALGTEAHLAALDSVLATLGKNEVIYVTDTIANIKKPWPLWVKVLAGMVGFGLLAGAVYYYKTRSTSAEP